MKQKVISLLSPLLLCWLRRVLDGLKPLFLREDSVLKNELGRQSFHPALCAHPSILFGERKNDKTNTAFLKFKVAYVKKCIKIGLLKDEKGHKLMRELGIQPCFGNGKDYWFVDSCFPMFPYHLPKDEKPEGKLVVYTALTGDYDDVHELLYKEDDVDYLLFTNNPLLTSRTWQVIFVQSELDNLLLSREIKMLSHKYLDGKYEASIYIDASVVVYGELSQLTQYLSDSVSLAVSKHAIRHSVKEEIEVCARIRGVDKMEAKKQYEKYLQEGFQDDQPLLECGLLIRKHKDQELQQLMQVWFEEFKNGVHRDQLSLLPCINRLRFDGLAVMDGSVWHNQFNRIQSHKRV